MEIYKPLCGNQGVHDPHLHWNADHTMGHECAGYTKTQQDIGTMVRDAEYIYGEIGYLGDVPIVLEVGLEAMAALQANVVPSFDEVLTGKTRVTKIDMPVQVSYDIQPAGWRIVVGQGVIGGVVGQH